MRVLILAAGGGHTGYAYALAQALQGRVSMGFLVPEGDLLSERRLREFGKVEFLIQPRSPSSQTPTHKFVPRLAKAFIDSIGRSFQEYDAVVSSGSNFCVAPALMAWLKGVPVVNMECAIRFVKPSKTVRALQPFSAITALQWEEQKQILEGTVVGPIFPKSKMKPREGEYILVAGGTHGHKPLFDALARSDLHNVVLQTGKVDPDPYLKAHPEWTVFTVTNEFNEYLAGAQLVVTHLGVTVLEAIVHKKPVVIVPNPEWTRTGGLKDAEHLAKKVNGVLVSEITLEGILEAIEEARNRTVPDLPDGAENLARIILQLRKRKPKE